MHLIRSALEATRGNQSRAAEVLGIKRSTLAIGSGGVACADPVQGTIHNR